MLGAVPGPAFKLLLLGAFLEAIFLAVMFGLVAGVVLVKSGVL